MSLCSSRLKVSSPAFLSSISIIAVACAGTPQQPLQAISSSDKSTGVEKWKLKLLSCSCGNALSKLGRLRLLTPELS